MTRQEKNLCYSLTTQSYAYIPTCETEKSCFEKVNALFSTDLGYQQETNLYELKNNLARSWFFYNKGIKELNNASKYCVEGNATMLPGAINQARDYLDLSFIEVDETIKKSFEIVSAQEKVFSSEKIDLAKEEAIFDSLVEIRQILSELAEGKTNSDSYVSYYLKKVENFNNSPAAKKQNYLIEKEPFWLSGYNYLDGTILKELNIGQEGAFPFIKNAFNNLINIVEFNFYKNESISALQQLPAKEFMLLYSELAGTNNSSIKRFADLMNRTSKNYSETTKKIPLIWKEIEEKKSACEKLAQEIKQNESYSLIQSELLSGEVVAQKNILILLEENKTDYLKLKQIKNQGQLTIGEELSKTKALNNFFTEAKKVLEEEKESNANRMTNACKEKAKELVNQKFEINNASLEKILSDTKYFASKTQSSDNDALYYCSQMLIKEKELEEGIRDYSELESKKIALTGNCFDYLETLFKTVKSPELNSLFNSLKKEVVTKENILYFEDACESIKTQLEKEIGEDETIKEIVIDKKAIEKNISILKEIVLYYDDTELNKKIEEYEKKHNLLDKYFSGEKITYDELYVVKEIVLSSIRDTLKSIEDYSEEKIIEYIKKSAKIIYMENTIASPDMNNIVLARIILNNPFKEISRSVSIETFFSTTEIISFDSCIRTVSPGNKTQIIFEYIPIGQTKIDFYTNNYFTLKESEKIIFASNEKSLLQKNIQIESELTYPRALIIVIKPLQVSSTIILVDNQESIYYEQGSKINFVINNASSMSKINCFFYINDLLSINITNQSSMQTDFQKKVFTYTAEVKNNYQGTLDATIVFPITINEIVEEINVYDEEKVSKQKEIIEGKITLKNQSFLAKQTRTYTLVMKVSNAVSYFREALIDAKNKLVALGEYDLSQEINEFVNFALDESSIKSAETLLNKATSKISEIEKQIESENANYIQESTFNEKITNAEKYSTELTGLNLFEESNKINSLIKEAKTLFDTNTKSSIAKAFEILDTAVFDKNAVLFNEAEKMWGEIQKSNETELSQIKKEFFDLKELFEETALFDPLNSQKKFIEMQEKYFLFIEEKNKLAENKNSALASIEKEITEMKKDCVSMISFLEKEINYSAESFIQLRFIPPITDSRLKKISLILEENVFDEKIKQTISDIYYELKNAVDSIKMQAIKKYNSGIENNFSFDVLSEAKQLIDENNFVEAMFTLNQKENGIESFPFVGFIPIIVIAISAIIIKKRFSKKEKSSDERKKEIVSEWEDYSEEQ